MSKPTASAAGGAMPAEGPDPDAALLAMQSAIDAADREFDAAMDALAKAEGAYSDKEPDRPKQPEIIFLPEEQQALDAFAAKLRARRDGPSLPGMGSMDQAVSDYEREVEV